MSNPPSRRYPKPPGGSSGPRSGDKASTPPSGTPDRRSQAKQGPKSGVSDSTPPPDPDAPWGVDSLGRRKRPPASFRGGAPKGNSNAKGNRGGRGRTPIYDPVRHPRLAFNAYLLPKMSQSRLAEIFGVTISCIEQWCSRHIEFREAIRKAKQVSITEVVRAGLESAKGYKHKEDKIFYDKDGRCNDCKGLGVVPSTAVWNETTKVFDGEPCDTCAGSGKGHVRIVKTVKHYPPNIRAVELLMVNREGWISTGRDKDDGGKGPISLEGIDTRDLSEETLNRIIEDIKRSEDKKREQNKGEG